MNWEHLPKNAINNETIEQAIIRLIAEHNNNATSHMGDGQSIDVHRKNEIIDHKAGSVLNDKLSFSEIEYYIKYLNTGDIKNNNYSTYLDSAFLQLYVNSSNVPLTWISRTIPRMFRWDVNKDYLFQSFFTYGLIENCNITFYYGIDRNINNNLPLLYFKSVNNIGKFVFKFDIYDYESPEFEFNPEISNVIRFQYIAGENKFYFFFNGENKGSIEILNIDYNFGYHIFSRLQFSGSDYEMEADIFGEYLSRQQ